MERRKLLKLAALSSLAASRPQLNAMLSSITGSPSVHTVLLVTKCHLDVGFTLTQAKVMQEYFDIFYPAAMKTAADLRNKGGDRYTWTTGSWLLYEYLEQATAAQRRAMEAAIGAGDINWHGLPFSWQTEMIDRSMINGSLGFSAELDRRFGHRTIGAKMTDVPGHSRGIISPLSAGGIRLLDIGVNPAPQPIDLPEVFLWKDLSGSSLAMLYHRHDYGGITEIPGSGIVVDVEVRQGDNSGPHTPAEISAIYAKLRRQYPNAVVKASSLNEVAMAVDRVRDQLPVVSSEIGDTWIYGCASDPYKVSRYREMSRLRESWIMQGTFAAGDSTDRNLLRRLLLCAEHTWGTDTKTYLDDEHYRPADLAHVLTQPGYKVMEYSWSEKRDNIDQAIATLPAPLRLEATSSMHSLRALPPLTDGMLNTDPARPIESAHFILFFDPMTGAIVRLRNRSTGREWASPQRPMNLFTYQTLSSADYVTFRERFITIKKTGCLSTMANPALTSSVLCPRNGILGSRGAGLPNMLMGIASSLSWHSRMRSHSQLVTLLGLQRYL